jgi:hypothetical protein
MTGYGYCTRAAKKLFQSWGLVWSEHPDEYKALVIALQKAAQRGYDDR